MDLAKFRLRFPEYADANDYSDELLTLLAEDSVAFIGADTNGFCGNYAVAQCYLVAHLLVLRLIAEAGGAMEAAPTGSIVSKTAHNVAVTYQQGTAQTSTETFFNGTRYGQYFLTLRKQCYGASMIVAGGSVGCHGCFAGGNFRHHGY